MNKVEKIVLFSAIAITLALVTFGVVSSLSTNDTAESKASDNYTLDVASGEVLAMAKARQAVAQSAVDGTGELSLADCSTLGDMAKKAEMGANWFADCSNVMYGSTPDSSNEDVLMLSDGEYCATFKLVNQSKELVSYTFDEGECGNTQILVK